jgi:hypothetical protein
LDSLAGKRDAKGYVLAGEGITHGDAIVPRTDTLKSIKKVDNVLL